MGKRWEQPNPLLGPEIGLSKFIQAASPNVRKFDCKVVGKWIDGWIFKTPKLSVEILEDCNPKFIDLKVSMAMYHAAKDGDVLVATARKMESGIWRVEE